MWFCVCMIFLYVIKTFLFYLDYIISSNVILCMHDFSVCLFNPAFQGCQNPINGLSLSWTDSAQTVASNSDQPAERKYWTYWPMATWLKLGQTKNNLLFKWLTAIESFNSYTALISRHVSFMRICSCRIFCLLPYFLHISAKCADRIFFRINWHFQRQF